MTRPSEAQRRLLVAVRDGARLIEQPEGSFRLFWWDGPHYMMAPVTLEARVCKRNGWIFLAKEDGVGRHYTWDPTGLRAIQEREG